MLKKIVMISDTHNRHAEYSSLPEGDLLIHCGDFTNDGTEDEFRDFLNWFSKQSHKYKIVVPGNHDKATENSETFLEEVQVFCKLHNINFLVHEAIEIEGVRFFGSPYLHHCGYKWFAYGKNLSTLPAHWSKIPYNTEILITHTPPHGILDEAFEERIGDEALLHHIQILPKLRMHCFGHVHCQSSQLVRGGVHYINACMYSGKGKNKIQSFKL